MLGPLYAIVALAVLACFVAWVFAFGVQRAAWLCLLLLPFRIILPPEMGRAIGFENLFLVPDVLFPITFLVWLLKRLAGLGATPRARVVPGAFFLVFVAFLLSAGPGMDARAYISEIEKWIAYTLAFVVVSQTIRTPDDLRRAATMLLVGGALATLRDGAAYFGLFTLPPPFGYQADTDLGLYSAFGRDRYQGTGGPVFINVLVLFIFVRLVVLGPALSRFKRWTLAAFGGALLVLLAMSFYRGDWVALAAALAASLAFPAMLSRRLVWTTASVVVVGGLVWALAVGGKFNDALRDRAMTLLHPGSEAHVIMRVDAMAEAWQMFREHPLTGIGAGQYGPNFQAYAAAQIYGQAIDPAFFQQANSDYFQYLATTGLIGFLALGALFSRFLRSARRLALAPAIDPWVRATLVGAFLGIVTILVDALSEDPMWVKTHGTLTFVLFAFISAAGWWRGREELRTPRDTASLAAT